MSNRLTKGNALLGASQVGTNGTKVLQLRKYSQALDPASVAANTSAEETFTVTGLATSDTILAVEKPTASAGLGIVGHRVSAANTLAVTFMNSTASPINPGSETYTIWAIKS